MSSVSSKAVCNAKQWVKKHPGAVAGYERFLSRVLFRYVESPGSNGWKAPVPITGTKERD
jgi:hypothetical protein